MVSLLDFFRQRHLTVDASDRFSAGETITVFETCDLCLAVGGDDDDCVDSFVYAGFEEERYVIDHHSMWIFSFGLSGEPGLFTRNAGVDDSFKSAQLGPVSENNGSQLTAIEGAVRIEDGLTECFDDLPPGRFARLDDFMGQFVGVDDDRAAMLEHLGDRALAGGDTACEAN